MTHSSFLSTLLRCAFCSCITLLLLACGSSQGPRLASDSRTPLDIHYKLPAVEVEWRATYQLRGCTPEDAGDKHPGFRVKTLISIHPKVTTEESPLLTFDPAGLPNTRHDQDVTVELYPNQTIKSINATSEDKTGAIVGGVIKTAANIARLVVGLGRQENEDTEPKRLCHGSDTTNVEDPKTILDHLAAADELVKLIGDQRKELRKAAKQASNSAGAKRVASHHEAIRILEAELVRIRTEHLTITKTETIKAGDLERSNVLGLTEKEVKKWLTDDGYKELQKAALEKWPEAPDPADRNYILATELYFATEGGPVDLPNDLADKKDALHLRPPIVTEFEVCEGQCVFGDGKRYASGSVAIPQWGKAESLHFNVGVFEKRVVVIGLSESGVVTKLGVNSPSRVARGIDFLSATSEQSVTFADVVAYGSENAQIKQLQMQIDLLEKPVKLKKAQEEFNKAFALTDGDEDGDSGDGQIQ